MSKHALSPDEVLAALQLGATKRTRDSLNLIHAICTEQNKAGNRDFSVATIGRFSSERDGPSAQAIRNKTGEHYRALLHAWASHVEGATRKPPAKPAGGMEAEILEMIDDSFLRAIVGSYLAEIRHLRKENTVLKMNANVVIDRRPQPQAGSAGSNPGPHLLSALSILLPLEIDALRHAISDELMKNMGWTMDTKNGRVSRGERPIFRAGFATAIRKIVDAAKR